MGRGGRGCAGGRWGKGARGDAAGGWTGRRALRGYWGRTETPPAKLSACATCHGAAAVASRHGRCGAAARAGRVGSPHGRPTAKHRALALWSTARVRAGQERGEGRIFGCNGGRARCPYRAARVMRVCNGGANFAGVMAVGRGRLDTHVVRGMPSRAPRWGAPTGGGGQAAHRAMWRGGAMGTSRPTATGPERGARAWSGEMGRGCTGEFCGCNGGRARCPYRAARVMGVVHEGCGMPSHAPRRWRGGAMRTSRPTATGPHHGGRQRDPSEGAGDWTRAVRTATRLGNETRACEGRTRGAGAAGDG